MLYKYYLVKHSNKLMMICLLFGIFIYQRQALGVNDTLISAFHMAYNERNFLSLYVLVYLISLFPILKQIFQIEYVTRVSAKWRFFEMLWVKISIMALQYSLLVSFGWYVIAGSGFRNFLKKEYVIYILWVFIRQFIGWLEIGMLETCIYILIHNLMLSFIICDALLILMNLSLYIGSNEQILQYTRLYDFMCSPEKNNGIYKVVSIGMFHVVIILLLFLICYEIIKRHDYITGGKREHAN